MIIIAKDCATAAQRRFPFRCVDATDYVTAETGLTFSAGELKLSKNGAATANHAGTVGEIGNGLYYYEPTAGEVDTEGFLTLYVVKSGVKEEAFLARVAGYGGTFLKELAKAIVALPTSDFEALVKAGPKCLGFLVMLASHAARDDGAGNIDVADSSGNYAGTNALTRAITATDAALEPISEIGSPS